MSAMASVAACTGAAVHVLAPAPAHKRSTCGGVTTTGSVSVPARNSTTRARSDQAKLSWRGFTTAPTGAWSSGRSRLQATHSQRSAGRRMGACETTPPTTPGTDTTPHKPAREDPSSLSMIVRRSSASRSFVPAAARLRALQLDPPARRRKPGKVPFLFGPNRRVIDARPEHEGQASVRTPSRDGDEGGMGQLHLEPLGRHLR